MSSAATPASTNVGGAKAVDGPEEGKAAIAQMYDQAFKIWEETITDHFHLGFYDSSSTVPGTDVLSAQIRMIEAGLCFASISEDQEMKPRHILDVGCGIGGTTRYLASKYGTQCKGITLSPAEVERARVLTAAQGLESLVSFEVADATNQPFPDGQFDLIWCIDCECYIKDKKKFVEELARVAAPGGTIIIITWCHRDLSPLEQDLYPNEKKIMDDMHSRNIWLSSTADYVDLLKLFSLQDIKHADWSYHVGPFFAQARKLTMSLKGIIAFIRYNGLKHLSLKGLTVPSLLEIYQMGLFRYCIITCRKAK